MKKSWIWILVGILVLLLIAGYFNRKNRDTGKEVTIEKVARHDVVERVAASGKIFPVLEVKISSDVSGEIVDLYVHEGDTVKKGQRLLKIDPEAYISTVQRGEAAVNNAKAQLEISKSNLQTTNAQAIQIDAQLKNAQLIYDRNKVLLEEGLISQADLEASLSNLDVLKANKSAAEANIQSGRDAIKAAEFTVKSQEAALKEMSTNLHRTTISAPSDGVISALNVEQGERVVGTIQMAGTEIMRIANFDKIEVQVEVTENDITRVQLGDETEIELDAYPSRVFKGSVTEIANSASNSGVTTTLVSDQATNFVVKILMDPDSYKDLIIKGKPFPLRPGLSASVEILTRRAKNAIAVPIQAVTTRKPDDMKDEKVELEDLRLVVFKRSHDTAQIVDITTGIQDEDYIVVKSGLKEGEEIITGPYQTIAKELEEGDEVKLKSDKKKGKK